MRKNIIEILASIFLFLWIIFGFVLMLGPVLLVIWLSLFKSPLPSFPPSGYSFHWYSHIYTDPQFFNGFLLSVKLAVIASLIGLLLSIPASLYIRRGSGIVTDVLINFLTAPLIVPAIVVGGAIYMFYIEVAIGTGFNLSGSFWGLLAGHVLLTIPWCTRLIVSGLEEMDNSLIDAGRTLGANAIGVFFKITLPQIKPNVIAAALFSFIISFSNIELSLFIVKAGETTLPIAILDYLKYRIDPTIAAVSTVQIAVVCLALLITSRLVSLSRALTK